MTLCMRFAALCVSKIAFIEGHDAVLETQQIHESTGNYTAIGLTSDLAGLPAS